MHAGLVLAIAVFSVITLSFTVKKKDSQTIQGAWQFTQGKEQTVIIITPYIFSSATYNLEEKNSSHPMADPGQ